MNLPAGNRQIDPIKLEWYETNKRIMHKKTAAGRQMSFKFLNQQPALTHNDVVFMDEATIITIEINPCEVIVLQPSSILEAASICYEIGNKHLPLFYDNNQLLVPFDQPVYQLLLASGYHASIETRQLLQPIKTSVVPHAHQPASLFSKILQLTTASS